MPSTPPTDPPVEKALEQIEKLVSEMESGKLGLDEVIARFEEGARLLKVCRDKLSAAEKRIEIIVREAGVPAGLAEFEEEEG
jgi:exodeoxyribonuclease VII small subunit